MGWRRAACKLYVEGSERGFVCSLIPGGHLQYSIGERLALYYFSVSLTGFPPPFFQGTLKKVRLKTSYLIWVGTPSHSNFISNFYLFLMENILLLLFTVANTHFQMAADCFFFNLQVSSVEIGLGLYLNIWLYRASVSLSINVLRSA